MSEIKTIPDKIYSLDGLELDTVLFEPAKKTKKVVIHIHGITGHYLQNHFLINMASTYPANGFAFMSFNNRGHDYIADVIKKGMTGGDRVQMGSAFDILEDCVKDIVPVTDYLLARGYDEIVLQGHSLGVLKVCYYLSSVRNHPICRSILISPMDVIHLLDLEVKDWQNWRNIAKNMIDSGRGQQYMAPKIWLNVPICADTFWNYSREDSNMWQFNFTHTNREFIHFRDIYIPSLVIVPQLDTYALGITGDKAKTELDKRKKNSTIKVVVMEQSGHSYHGKENELVRKITEWL